MLDYREDVIGLGLQLKRLTISHKTIALMVFVNCFHLSPAWPEAISSHRNNLDDIGINSSRVKKTGLKYIH